MGFLPPKCMFQTTVRRPEKNSILELCKATINSSHIAQIVNILLNTKEK